MMTVSEIAGALRSRDVVFNVLSQVFIDVPDETTDKLIEETAELIAGIAEATENEDFREGVARLSGLYSGKGSIGEWLSDTRLDRSRAFTSLFILVGQASASVYESVHRSAEKLMKQESWSEVKAFYQQNGFCRSDDTNISEDHISIELQFMGLLSGKAAEACEKDNFNTCEEILGVQLRFYEEHLSQWIPEFCTRIAENNDNEIYTFYAAYALILKGFMAEDMLFLKELLED